MSDEIPNKNITLEQLEDMFFNMENDAKWNTKIPMLWGYYFTHSEAGLLEKARDMLLEKDYRFVDIYQTEPDEDNPADLWWLHVEKEELHTPQTLDKKNDEFYLLAHELGIDAYDGMDVSPVAE